MVRKAALSLLMALLVLPGSLRAAPPGPLDLIPADAAVGLAVRNLDELRDRGDKLIADSQAQLPFRLSDGFGFVFGYLGVSTGLDHKQSAALVVVNPDRVGKDLTVRNNSDELMVAIVPFTNRDDMAANFGIKKGDLKPDTMSKGQREDMRFGKFLYAKGSHLYLGNNEKAVRAALQGKPIADQFPEARRNALAGTDVLLVLNSETLKNDRQILIDELERSIQSTDPAEKEMLQRTVRTLVSFRYLVASLRIDDGLGFSMLLSHPKPGDAEAQKLLKELAGGSLGASGLAGLPEGDVIAAQAFRGDAARNALLVKGMLNWFLQYFLETKQLLSTADRISYVNVFTDVWQRLQGTRAALYHTGDDKKLGLFSLVAILDAEDPRKFLAALQALMQFADGSVLKRSVDNEEPAKLIEKLIRELDDNDFFVRHAATTKLELIGEPALPYLEKVLKSKPTLELSTRAERLAEGMRMSAAERRKELLAKDLPRPVRPKFAFAAKAEVRGGLPVDAIIVKLEGQDTGLVPQLRQLFGPDWDKIRLVAHGQNIVALVGSDTRLLDAALVNLKENKPGLAGEKSLAPFVKHGDRARQFEMHASAGRAMALFGGEGAVPARTPGLTSVSLAVDAEHVQLDLWIPPTELGVILKVRW